MKKRERNRTVSAVLSVQTVSCRAPPDMTTQYASKNKTTHSKIIPRIAASTNSTAQHFSRIVKQWHACLSVSLPVSAGSPPVLTGFAYLACRDRHHSSATRALQVSLKSQCKPESYLAFFFLFFFFFIIFFLFPSIIFRSQGPRSLCAGCQRRKKKKKKRRDPASAKPAIAFLPWKNTRLVPSPHHQDTTKPPPSRSSLQARTSDAIMARSSCPDATAVP